MELHSFLKATRNETKLVDILDCLLHRPPSPSAEADGKREVLAVVATARDKENDPPQPAATTARTDARTHAHTHARTHAQARAYKHAHTDVRTQARMRRHACAGIHACMRACTYTQSVLAGALSLAVRESLAVGSAEPADSLEYGTGGSKAPEYGTGGSKAPEYGRGDEQPAMTRREGPTWAEDAADAVVAGGRQRGPSAWADDSAAEILDADSLDLLEVEVEDDPEWTERMSFRERRKGTGTQMTRS